jgi:hypothetical protein
VGAACASALPLLFFVIPESPRWLIMNNRKEEAIKILLKVNIQNMARKFYQDQKIYIEQFCANSKAISASYIINASNNAMTPSRTTLSLLKK